MGTFITLLTLLAPEPDLPKPVEDEPALQVPTTNW